MTATGTSARLEGRSVLLLEQPAARWLGVELHTLQWWRRAGIGPPCTVVAGRAGRIVRYRREDLDRWLEERGAAS